MKIAIVDDEPEVSGRMAALLSAHGHTVLQLRDGASAFTALQRDLFDLLLIDWSLPDANGLELLAWVRENLQPSPAIIVVTARNREEDVIAGLLSGADDFITKPIVEGVFNARVEAVLRRVCGVRVKSSIESFGVYVFDSLQRTLTIDDTRVALTSKEFALALLLFRNMNRPLSREYIFQSVWDQSPEATSRTLDVHMAQLRNRLDLRPENNFRLSSVYGFGYRLEQLGSTQGERTEATPSPRIMAKARPTA